MYRTLNLSTRDGKEMSSGEFMFFLTNANISRSPYEKLSYRINSIAIPQGYYQTIRTDVTDTLDAQVLDADDNVLGTATLTFTAGDYTTNQLITEIETKWTASTLVAHSGITITYSRTTKKLSFVPTTVDRKIVLSSTSRCSDVIGLSADITATYGTAKQLQNVANMNTVTCIYVHSSISPSMSYDSALGDRTNIVANIPVDKVASILVHTATGTDLMPLEFDHLSYITLSLRDDHNRPLSNNGVSWTINVIIRKDYATPISPPLPPPKIEEGIKSDSKTLPPDIKEATTTTIDATAESK